MSEDELHIDVGALCEYTGPVLSNCYVGIKVPMHNQGEPGVEKMLAAKQALADIGVTFDWGLGFGLTDWEFDWSLSGAAVRLKPLFCLGCSKYLESGVWPCRVMADGAVRVHCSPECRIGETREGIDLNLMMYSGAKPPPATAFNDAPETLAPSSPPVQRKEKETEKMNEVMPGEELFEAVQTSQGHAFISDGICDESLEVVIEIARNSLYNTRATVNQLRGFIKKHTGKWE